MKPVNVLTMLILAIGVCAALAAPANAQCGVALNHNKVVFPASMAAMTDRVTAPEVTRDNGDDATIVGLWDVKFISENQVVDEGFDQYHSDGTEILNDTPPPATGNVCLGVYEKSGARGLKLKHPSWIYEPSNTFVIGRATILESITVDRGGKTFKGTFTIQFRDLAGNPLAPDFTGQLRGDRITPD
jgi:hypothetical protein